MTDPSTPVGREMTDREARSFLASKDNGVLSLGVDDDGYGFPIAYSFADDDDDDQLVLGFVTQPPSKKRRFADETDTATFTVYEFDDVDVWRSVVVEGAIDRLDDDQAHRVPDIFYQQAGDDEIVNLDEFDRTWYALDIDSISGRESGRQG